jgi:putative membrane protein
VWRAAAGAAAFVVLALAIYSPLDEMADALFSAHMVQHLLLILVVPPLFVAAAPGYVGLWALPEFPRRRVTRWWRHARGLHALAGRVLRPVPVWLASAAVLWCWHLPVAYDAAVRHEGLHVVEHASFLATSCAFWWLLFRFTNQRRRMDRGAGVVYVFTAGLQCSALGALIAFAGHPWYAVHLHTTAAWGMTPMQDQRMAGLIMWIPAGLAYLGAAAVLFLQWIECSSTPESCAALAAGSPPATVGAPAVPGSAR